MKKIIFLAMVIMSLQAKAQKVTVDDVSKGVRMTSTERTICRSLTDKMVLAVSLSSFVYEDRKDTVLYLNTQITGQSPQEMAKDGKMLLKLSDGSVIELSSTKDKTSEKRTTKIGGTIMSDYSITPWFKISRGQLDEIIAKGVQKVRIELAPEFYDKEFNKDKIGKALGEQEESLFKVISKPKKSVNEGF